MQQQTTLNSLLKHLLKNHNHHKTILLNFSKRNASSMFLRTNRSITTSFGTCAESHRMFTNNLANRNNGATIVDSDHSFETSDFFVFVEKCILLKKQGNELETSSNELFEMVESEANNGNPRAIFNMGEFYAVGFGREIDYSKALEYYMKAAQCNYNKGKHMVGFFYKNGYGVTRNLTTAFEWFLKSATGGLPLSAYEVGSAYLSGHGCKQNLKLAMKWGLQAATSTERDIPQAKELVGKLYLFEQNYSESFKWLSKASDDGLLDSKYWLGWMYLNGKGVEEDFTLAMDYFLESQQSAESCYRIGTMYEMGLGVSIDKEKYTKWYMKGAEMGSKSAQYMVGLQMLENEEYAKAYEYLLKSSKQGNASAMHMLGSILMDGRPDVKQNKSEGKKWIEMAKQAGYKP